MMRSSEVYTIGHSTHDFSQLLGLLKSFSVELLLDVRNTHHVSFFPEFSRRNMKMRLVAEGIVYVFMGDLLGKMPKAAQRQTRRPETALDARDQRPGGRSNQRPSPDEVRIQQSVPFLEGVQWILEQSRNARIALFCGEGDPYGCHRHYRIGQSLMLRGLRVYHILPTGQLEEAQPDLFHRPDGPE